MNYKLTPISGKKKSNALFRKFLPFLDGETSKLIMTLIAILISSFSNLIAPIIIGTTIDKAIGGKDVHTLLINTGWLILIYSIGSIASYIQIKVMGGVGRRLLFRIRNALFNKLQELPIAFFNQNKSGDLISRINSDTDKLNQFISQALMQFIGNFFLILGTGIFMLVLHPKLALVTLIPAVGIVMITSLLSPWVKRKNKSSLESLGSLSAEVQESLSNFKVVVAFNRLDYFRQKFQDTNEKNYKKSLLSGIASTIFIPIYSLATNSASLLCLIYGLSLIGSGNLTIGLLIGFQFYVNNFYSPLRQIASVWSSFQLALASLERVREVLDMRSDLTSIPTLQMSDHTALLEFQNVSFEYATGVKIINAVNFSLEKGKTYALVGPTGGGKTTIASLMARLYDTSEGTVFLHGKDIRSYSNSERTEKIGFILQEPFLFSGSLRDNILYGNKKYEDMSEEILTTQLEKYGLSTLLKNFKEGLDTKIITSTESISLGQKQIIAFMRAVLRNPELLILDEATANIDTVTEELLETILSKLPKTTTKVIIAHRLNTIKNADAIFFVNAGKVVLTGSMQNAIDMLLHRSGETGKAR